MTYTLSHKILPIIKVVYTKLCRSLEAKWRNGRLPRAQRSKGAHSSQLNYSIHFSRFNFKLICQGSYGTDADYNIIMLELH